MKKIISIIACIALLCTINVNTVNANEEVSEYRICAVGDNIVHSRIIKSGIEEDDTRNYDDIYRYYKEYLKNYDICVVNQETVFVEDEADFSAYPRFGGPEEIGLSLMNAGFNMVTMATNHVLDKGLDAMINSRGFWIGWGIDPVGVYGDNKFYEIDDGKWTYTRLIRWKLEDGLRVGFLNYTYGTNGLTLSEEDKWRLGTLDDKETVEKEIRFAKGHCEVVMVFVHWGEEYQYMPSSSQREWAQFFADNGADIIIGTHPHVIQPLEYITAKDGRQVPCYYSLGNFMSNQDEVPRMLGAAASFTIRKDKNGVSVTDVMAVPTVTHISSYSESFYAKSLFDYTVDEEEQHRMRRIKGEKFSIDNLWKLWYSVFIDEQTGDFIKSAGSTIGGATELNFDDGSLGYNNEVARQAELYD